MPARASAFGPTTGPSVRSAGSGGLAQLASSDGGDFTSSLSRFRSAPQEQFQPLFPEQAAAPEAPPEGTLPSAPLIAPGQQTRSNVLQRLSGGPADTGRNDTQNLLGNIATGVKGVKSGLKLAEGGQDLFERILGDAGFSADAIKSLMPTLQGFLDSGGPTAAGGALDPGKFSLTAGAPTGSMLEQLAAGGDLGDLGSALGSDVASGLGDYAPYLGALVGGLNIGQTAASDTLTDSQKAAASAAQAAQAAVTYLSAIFPIAAPIAPAIGAAIEYIVRALAPPPSHDVREKYDVANNMPMVGAFRRDLDYALTPEDLWKRLLDRSATAVGGKNDEQMKFITRLNANRDAPFLGNPNTTYSTVSLEDVLAHPDQVSVFPQWGVGEQYLAPARDNLSTLVRNRFALFARARQGDPEALAALQVLKGRATAYQQQQAEKAHRDAASEAWSAAENERGSHPVVY